MATYNDTLTENITASLTDLQAQGLTLLLDITVADATTSESIANILEAIDLVSVLGTLDSQFHISADEIIDVADLVAVLWNNTLLENITVADTVAEILRYTQLVSELVHLYDSGLSTGVLNASVAVSLALADLVSNDAFEAVLEDVTMQETLVDLLYHIGLILDDVTASSAVSEFVAFFTLVEDDLTGSDAVLNTANLKTFIEDGWIITTSYVHDGNTYTGWLMNPENYAISTYTNYQFNSVTNFNNKTVLANTSGLYEMGGTTDASSYINSKIKTAAMNFGSSSQKQVPEVLLGVNNSGKVILVVSVDGQLTSTYQLNAPTSYLDTQRIKIGKGMHGRYWQFELHTEENSDFDLDTFEFFPIAFGRKLR